MKRNLNRSVRVASLAAVVALVLLCPWGHTRVLKLRHKTSLTPQSPQAPSKLWLQHFRPRVLWIL